MGNTNQTMRKQPDNSTYICTDIIERVKNAKSRYGFPVLNYEPSISPSLSDHLWNWWTSKPTCEFHFDHYKSNPQAESFGDGIRRIVNDMAVTDQEALRIVSLIIDDLDVALRNRNVPRIWRCYGSYQDGLCCKNSDIDLYYSLKGKRYDDGFFKEIGKAFGLVESDNQCDAETIPKRMEQLLRQSPLFAKVHYIQTAKIPIIKLYHLATKKKVDITYNLTSIMNTELMKFYVFSNCNVKYLTLFLRRSLKKHDLHGTNRITTTILFWLVVYFMQRMELLPSVHEIRNMRGWNKCYDCGWDYSVPPVKISDSTPHSGQLSLLLLNFLKYYRDYHFSRFVICPLIGNGIPISAFKNLRLERRSFSVYLEKLNSGEIDCFPISYINLQDPTILCNNLAKQTNEKTINQFKIFCYYAYEDLSKLILSPRTEYQLFRHDYFLPINCLYSDPSDRWHNNLMQYFTLSLKFYQYPETNPLKSYKLRILSAIFAVMRDIFSFHCDFCLPMNGDRKRKLNDDDTSWTYLIYSADCDTWKNSFIRRIYRLVSIPRNVNITQQSISVCMLCEINETRRRIKILLQSELHLCTFLKSNFNEILESVLNEFDIHVERAPYMY